MRMSATLLRFVAYGLLGWGIEIVWTAARGVLVPGERSGRWRLVGTTYIWMFPIYGSMVFLYEPLHDLLRPWPWPVRAVVYAFAFLAVEYLSGWLLRRATGACPWDYARRERPSRWQVHGLVRLDYGPAWAGFGLALEPVHEFLLKVSAVVS